MIFHCANPGVKNSMDCKRGNICTAIHRGGHLDGVSGFSWLTYHNEVTFTVFRNFRLQGAIHAILKDRGRYTWYLSVPHYIILLGQVLSLSSVSSLSGFSQGQLCLTGSVLGLLREDSSERITSFPREVAWVEGQSVLCVLWNDSAFSHLQHTLQ